MIQNIMKKKTTVNARTLDIVDEKRQRQHWNWQRTKSESDDCTKPENKHTVTAIIEPGANKLNI